jgi:hypothetical protein
VRLDGVGEEPAADARGDRDAADAALPGCRGAECPIRGTGRPLMEMGPQSRSRAGSSRYLRLKRSGGIRNDFRAPQGLLGLSAAVWGRMRRL